MNNARHAEDKEMSKKTEETFFTRCPKRTGVKVYLVTHGQRYRGITNWYSVQTDIDAATADALRLIKDNFSGRLSHLPKGSPRWKETPTIRVWDMQRFDKFKRVVRQWTRPGVDDRPPISPQKDFICIEEFEIEGLKTRFENADRGMMNYA